MWWWQYRYNPTAYDDDWEDQPSQGWFFKWIVGVCVPLVLAGYGVDVIVSRCAEFGGQVSMTLAGSNAAAFGSAWLSAALFLHCHYYWGNVYNQAWPAVFGKIVAACGFLGGIGFLLIHNGVLGRR